MCSLCSLLGVTGVRLANLLVDKSVSVKCSIKAAMNFNHLLGWLCFLHFFLQPDLLKFKNFLKQLGLPVPTNHPNHFILSSVQLTNPVHCFFCFVFLKKERLSEKWSQQIVTVICFLKKNCPHWSLTDAGVEGFSYSVALYSCISLQSPVNRLSVRITSRVM